MSESCFKKNELLIPGTRQDERMYEALNPTYVMPDERSIANLMVFITKYAGLINYYALKGAEQTDYSIDGDWKPLILSDEAFNYAGISVTPYSLPNITFYKYVNLYETGSTTDKRIAAYRVCWDVLFSVYSDINAFYTALPVYMPLRNVLAAEIDTLSTDMLNAAARYINAWQFIPSIQKPVPPPIKPWILYTPTDSKDDEYKFRYAGNVLKESFEKTWMFEPFVNATSPPLPLPQLIPSQWTEYTAKMEKLSSEAFYQESFGFTSDFFGTAVMSDFDRIDYSTLQLKQIFKRAFESYTRIIATANEYLQSSLKNNSAHFAHHGLLLAFLKLFGILQSDINQFTRKHLEYYYSRVLRIDPAPATPDAAHIVLDPAKNITTHLVEKNTVLNAGKDGLGKLLLYNTDEEIVINQAKLAELKTIFLKPAGTTGDIEKVYASSAANSSDGNGADFTGEDNSWKGFGNELNLATLGFYIASPVLHLVEGKRTVEMTFTTDAAGMIKANALTKPDILKYFNFSFSGEKKWESLIINDGVIADFNSELTYTAPVSANSFKITLVLLPQFAKIVGYDPEVCEGNLDTVFPVVRCALNQSETGAYEKLKGISISTVNITTVVEGMTGLSLQNELGTLDPSKPVSPFGPLPKIGSTFLVGHPELVHKEITSLSVNLNWLDLPANIVTHYSYIVPNTPTPPTSKTVKYVNISGKDDFKVSVEFIRNKAWVPVQVSHSSIFGGASNGANTTLDYNAIANIKKPLQKPVVFTGDAIAFDTATTDGFLRFSLTAPLDNAFGHSKWAMVFAAQTVAITKDPANNSLPNPPYTPLLSAIRLKYTATQVINLNNSYKADQGQFFHLLPFGVKQLNNGAQLLPKFELEKKQTDGTLNNELVESALYFGISNANINQNISLLVQVNEGTEDISVDPPVITWNYLSNTGWKNFNNALLADATDNLLKSGIVKFQVPADINKNVTELTPGYTWICAAIEPDFINYPKISSSGLPKVLAVFTNAVKAGFTNNENDPDHLGAALPAGSISKLYESDAAIKKVNQPYASFGGKKIEEGSKFYTKTSERLRHKHRAITIWDYERLVLDEFQEVYMVKCLNHTGYEKDCVTGLSHYRENIPGRVMLIPVPFVTNLNAGNIYQPTLSAAKLSDIKNFIRGADNSGTCNKYIKALHCQLAVLEVENPKYETIKVSCKMRVKQCLDQLFYESQLIKDLNGFLSPWISGDTGKISFGGKLHASQVVYFIEQLYYIDYLENLTIEHKDGNTVLNLTEPSLAVATTSRSVLTSFGTHTIQKA